MTKHCLLGSNGKLYCPRCGQKVNTRDVRDGCETYRESDLKFEVKEDEIKKSARILWAKSTDEQTLS